MPGNLLRDIDPAPDRHRALGEVAEFVRQHGLEFGKRQDVDQAQADQQVFSRRKQQVDDG